MTEEHDHLDRVIDHLAGQYPQHDPRAIAEMVYLTYARLRETATIDTHLPSLTQRHVGDLLARSIDPDRFPGHGGLSRAQSHSA